MLNLVLKKDKKGKFVGLFFVIIYRFLINYITKNSSINSKKITHTIFTITGIKPFRCRLNQKNSNFLKEITKRGSPTKKCSGLRTLPVVHQVY